MRFPQSRLITVSLIIFVGVFVLTSKAPVNAIITPLPRIGTNMNNYVPPATADCDSTVPTQFIKIQSAIDAASDGDRVCVLPGTYKENLIIPKTITLSGLGVNSTMPKVIGQKINYTETLRISGNNVVVEGLYIKGAGSDITTATVRLTDSFIGSVLRYNKLIANVGENVVRGDAPQNDVMIENNILSGNLSPYLVIIDGQPSVGRGSNNIRILNNKFIGKVAPSSNPIFAPNSGIELLTRASNNLIKGNVFTASGTIQEIIQATSTSNIVTQNNLKSITFSSSQNAPIKVHTISIDLTDATHNWWGDIDPLDNVQGNIDYSLFESRAFPVY